MVVAMALCHDDRQAASFKKNAYNMMIDLLRRKNKKKKKDKKGQKKRAKKRTKKFLTPLRREDIEVLEGMTRPILL
jgi:hypothetical protein